MVPVNVPGLSKKRLNELDPFNYRDLDEMKKLLRSQISSSKLALDVQSPGLPSEIYSSCLLYTSPSPRDATQARMPSSA